MHWLILVVFNAGPSLSDCESPPVRDVSALQTFAQKSGALSVGLDSVATWCFDSGGEWTGGAKVDGKKRKGDSTPVGDCARSLNSCETAKTAVTSQLKTLLNDALSDLERPYLRKKYVPKRSGLADRPSDLVDCTSRGRADLFAQAQARMDLARLASQVFNEYANYRTWLYAEGLKCTLAARTAPVDRTQRQVAVDAPPVVTPNPDQHKAAAVAVQSPEHVAATVDAGADLKNRAQVLPSTSLGVSGVPVRPSGADAVATSTIDAGRLEVARVDEKRIDVGKPVLPVGGPTTERERVNTLPPVEKWLALALTRSRLELDRDYTLGFLASHELRDCRCQRPNPTGIARRYSQSDNVPQLEADETKNTQCEFCLQDAFAAWKVRLEKQCALIDKLSEFEVGVLQRSDDGNGLPPRCFDSVTARRAAAAGLDGGQRATVSTGAPVALGAVSPQAAAVAPPVQTVATPLADSFSRAQDWAPIPLREDGRLYVRLFMSSGCAADVLPGPIQARTGDLLMIPYNARQLSVRSPCGGLAEVYWGREVKPRVSEIFARNQPLHLQFQPQ